MKPSPIAIIGLAGRFPGAQNPEAFWRNLRDGVESVRDLSDAELRANGVSEDEIANPDYVKRASILDNVSLFDASFFGFSPRDASIVDPQHRHFLECAWEAFEDAGHPPSEFKGSVGVFAGSGMNSYLIHNLLANRRLLETAGLFQLKQTGNDKDVLTTRVSYLFDLRGPSINVQTACSTSLVAVHLASQSLLNLECDMALAGGVTIEFPHGQGYVYRDGEILSRDGHCRAFDASSSGTVFGSGLGIVVLRRLEDALKDGDHVRALILGSAVNNDGARKVGYLAPSVEGQAEVIAEALDFAGVSACDLSYVEAHGTGTRVGDPIEIRALTQAFRTTTPNCGFCALGSLKTNIGHLDAAAGVAGLIKTVLALENEEIPASLHFDNINPHIEIATSPFFVNDKLRGWKRGQIPRRAGVTSLGIGGTNAHVVVEEAPLPELQRRSRPCEVLTVSGKSSAAADKALENLSTHLKGHPEANLEDVAFTLQVGREAFAHRRVIVAATPSDAIEQIAASSGRVAIAGDVRTGSSNIVFMFSGQGSQYVNMGFELFQNEPVFRDALGECARKLAREEGIDLLQFLYPKPEDKEESEQKLSETWLTQPALFAVEYALARWWMSLGVEPSAMVGHSIGEYVAACLAGVFTLDDALRTVALRGRLIFGLPAGAMLAVPIAAASLSLCGDLSIAAINHPNQCVVSGPSEKIDQFEREQRVKNVGTRRLVTSHAFHSAMMEPILQKFRQHLIGTPLSPPRIPYLSNVTGTWIRPEEATDPSYWVRHIRETVQFASCLQALFASRANAVLEVGPGNVLTALALQQTNHEMGVFSSLLHPREQVSGLNHAFTTLGKLWVAGAPVNWNANHTSRSAVRISLPTYPFEKQRFWIDADPPAQHRIEVSATSSSGDAEKAVHLYHRIWKKVALPDATPTGPLCWVVFRDSAGLGDRLIRMLIAGKEDVICVDAGAKFRQIRRSRYVLEPSIREGYDELLAQIIKDGFAPRKFVHLWPVVSGEDAEGQEKNIQRSFFSPLYLAQALGAQDISGIDIAFVSNSLQKVSSEHVICPERAVLFGPALVVPKELPGIHCVSLDFDISEDGVEECASRILAELRGEREDSTVAFRGTDRFVESFERLELDHSSALERLEENGVYLITGGMGGIGLAVAEELARRYKARLVLVGRAETPDPSQWDLVLGDKSASEVLKERIRRLIEIRSHAGALFTCSGDVSDLTDMRSIVALARREFGKIDGVYHAAGVLDDGPLMNKKAEDAKQVLNAKVRGTLVLEEVLRDDHLKFFVLFSSISSIFPPPGQVDYAAANAFLDAFARSRGGNVVAVNWGAWRGVGMAAGKFFQHPLLQTRNLESSNEIAFQSRLVSSSHWLLSEHRIKNGSALIPGTAYLEMAASAYLRNSLQVAIKFTNVYFTAPLKFSEGELQDVCINLVRDLSSEHGEDSYKFSIYDGTNRTHEYCSGSIAPCQTSPQSWVDRAEILSRCKREIIFDEEHRTRQEVFLDFGPRWHCLQRVSLGLQEGVAELELDPTLASDLKTFQMHPALLDMATGCALYLTPGYSTSDDLYLPFSYKRISVFERLPRRFFSHIRARSENHLRADVENFDITLFDDENHVLVEIEGFALRRLEDPSMQGDRQASDTNSRAVSPLGGAESSISVSGISPDEGVKMLMRILSHRTPDDVMAISEPLPDRIGANRIQLSKTMVASVPTEAVDATLLKWWVELLGVERIDLDDDFFALGGHSLVGIRLFAKIKKTYKVDLELGVLFEARTVRQLVEVIRRAQKPNQAEKRAYSCLVPIQTRGSRTPLFCVHAIGGDVLFYEKLAKSLGPSQPFYAFRSPLISQSPMRETSLEELASIYIKEMRVFYPEGPYMIGGLSYGGLIAFEMAQQLMAQGIEPGLLVLFDTSVPGSVKNVEATDQLLTFWQNLREQGPSYIARKAAAKTSYWRRIMHEWTESASLLWHQIARADMSADLRYLQVQETHKRALEHYKFRLYPGKITLMRAVDHTYVGIASLSQRTDPELGWGGLAGGGLEIHDVSAGHSSMLLEPSVRMLAEMLKTIILSSDTTALHTQAEA